MLNISGRNKKGKDPIERLVSLIYLRLVISRVVHPGKSSRQ